MVMDFIPQCGGEGFTSSRLQPSLMRLNRLGKVANLAQVPSLA